MLDAAYALLGKVLITADLRLDTPGGGHILVASKDAGELVIRCSDEDALWAALGLADKLGLVDLTYQSLKQLRNPLLQTIAVTVADRTLLSWPPGNYPRVKSLRVILNILRKR